VNYPAFTNDSLTMMYEAVRGAPAADEALKAQGAEARFRVRETPDWKRHASELETEMLKRAMFFEDQASLPFGTEGAKSAPLLRVRPAGFSCGGPRATAAFRHRTSLPGTG
jgi:hypothetical protein